MNKGKNMQMIRQLFISVSCALLIISTTAVFAGPPLPDERRRDTDVDDEELQEELMILGERYVDLIDELEDVLSEYEEFFQIFGQVSMQEYQKAIHKFRESLEREQSAQAYDGMVEHLDELIAKLESVEKELEVKKSLQSRDLRNLRSLGYDLEDIREELHEGLAEARIHLDIDSEELSKAISQAYAEAARAMARAREAYRVQVEIPSPPSPTAIDERAYRHLEHLYVSDFSGQLTRDKTSTIDDRETVVELENPLGGVTVRTWNKSEVTAVLTIGFSQGSEKSRTLAENIQLVLDEAPDAATFRVDYPDDDEDRVRIVSSLLEVSLPRENPVAIKNSFGPVSIAELDNRLMIRSQFAPIEIQKIKGRVDIENSSGSVYLEDIRGRVDISNSFEPVEVVYLKGDANISNSYAPTMIKKSSGRLDIDASGMVTVNSHKGDVDIHSSNGEMDIYGITGSLVAVNSFGRMRVEDVSGDADIENANAETEIAQIGGRLTVSNKFAPISVEDVDNDATVKSSNARIVINNVKGNLHVVNRFGEVTAESIGGTVRITNANAPVTVSDVLSPVSVVNLFGPVYIAGVAGDVEVDNQNASVDLIDIEGGANVSTSFGLITGENLGGPFIIANDNGSVELTRVTRILADCEVTTSFGDIILELPQGKSFNLVAKTSGGEIKSSLPLRLTSSGSVSSGELIVSQADPTITLTGKNSTIKILTR